MTTAVREFLAEPAVADPPPRTRRDVMLVGAIVISAILETFVRNDLQWPVVELLVCLWVAPTMLWRRSHPLAMSAIAFGMANMLGLAGAAFAEAPPGLYTTAILLLLPYALFRWASGRHAAIGAVIILSAWLIGITTDPGTVGDAVGGFIVLTIPVELGLIVRYRGAARDREIGEIKLREREQLARELHDTVAHHVSAIAVQAQAAQAIAPSQPEAALEILAVIEEAASRTLAEMRTMVGTLRRGDDAKLAPQEGVADLDRLADVPPDAPTVRVEKSGRLDGLEPIVSGAIYRIAQESVTNAARHGRGASRVDVKVVGLDDCVRLTVSNDGVPVHADPAGSGAGTSYGLLGMSERAKLLGGTFNAGPMPEGGWQVSAELPRVRADQ